VGALNWLLVRQERSVAGVKKVAVSKTSVL
jgi:hypothetical protein